MSKLCVPTPSHPLNDAKEMVPTEPMGPLRVSAIRTALAIVVSLILATFVACSGGVRLATDSPVMLNSPQSMSFVGGGPSLGSPGYRAIVAASVAIGTGLAGVVVLQVFVATLAAIRLLTVGRAMGGTLAGLAAVALFTLNPDQIRWHAYILPDSLYTSVLILTVAAILDAWSSPRPDRLLAPVACGLGAGVLNATGYLLVPIALAAWLVKWGTVHKVRWAGPPTVVAALACCLAMLPSVQESCQVATTGQGASRQRCCRTRLSGVMASDARRFVPDGNTRQVGARVRHRSSERNHSSGRAPRDHGARPRPALLHASSQPRPPGLAHTHVYLGRARPDRCRAVNRWPPC